jgi:phage terminase large subunit-like protein
MTAAVAAAWNPPGECPNCRQDEKRCVDGEAHFWMPADTIAGGKTTWSKPMLEQLRRWADEGWLNVIDGGVIDDSDVQAQIEAWAAGGEVEAIAVDPWQARQLRIDLEDKGFIIFEHRQTMQAMNPSTKLLVELVTDRRFHHGGNPILRWMADNVIGRTDSDANLKPDKQKSSGKIDGITAAVMALTCITLNDETSNVQATLL